MFLKSLELFGFKSFADRITIDFSDGITALLGPNGCGKSNVVDAIKWVLGERSPRNMRAEKMEDVIFSGTENRKPLNVAEVTLTINNENALLPVDLTEVAIKRRFYRSGENEFYINNAQVRLKDIQELFWDTGVGKSAYSVMEQGKIDQILSNKPEDRRYLFEEAAGITRYKMERAGAERKLERTEENMRQVDIMLNEVKRSHDSLKVQAEKTGKYRTLRDEVFGLERDIQLLKLKGLTGDLARFSSDFEAAKTSRDRLHGEIDEINRTLSANMDAVNEMEVTFNELQKEIIALFAAKVEKEKQAKQWAERRGELRDKITLLETRAAAGGEKIEALVDDIGDQESSLHAKRKAIDETEKNIASFQENITLAGAKITGNDREAAQCEQNAQETLEKRKGLQKDLAAITEDIVTELDSRLKEAGYSSAASNAARERVLGVLGRLSTLAEGRKNLFSDFAAIAEPKPGETREFAQKAIAAFSEIQALAGELQGALDDYVNSTPAFINEFLAPGGIITKKRAIDRQIRENEAEEGSWRKRIEGLKAENAGLVVKIDEYRSTLESLKLNRVQMLAQIEGAEEQIRLLKRELGAQENALREIRDEQAGEQRRLEETEENLRETEEELAETERKGTKMTEQLEGLEKSISQKNSDVSGKQERLKKKTEESLREQAKVEGLAMRINTCETEIRGVKESFMETHSRDLLEFEERMFTLTDQPAVLRERLAEKRQALKDLGNVNLMAPEEYAETKERYDFLTRQMGDLKKAKDDLLRITEEIRAESTERFLATYNKIKKNFHNMFRRLFDGGRAELRLVDPKDVLESGVEIFAQPPGKKLENIALLSGGEKTMTAVALLFATYMVHPSPFCLLDEIDAALDEKNIGFFVNTLREFAHVSQYIVISHNKRTAAGAGTLLGITMEESGVSKLFSIRIDEREKELPFNRGPFEEEEVEPEAGVVIPSRPPKRQRGDAAGEPRMSEIP
ncbi:MAG: AAA family ATPase [Spirochaetaceae bacterium]|nr:AAA family ATPase [Spirochaetaceae bacterium]